MAIDPTSPNGLGLLNADSGGGFYGFSPLTNFGLGLLQQAGPSLTPQSPWAAIGKAGQFASDAQQKAFENQIYRQDIIQKQQEQAGLQRVQEFFKGPAGQQLMQDQPLMAGLLSTGYPEAIRGVAAAVSDPNFAINLATNKATLAGTVATNTNLFTNASTGEQAVETLRKYPGSEIVLKNPSLIGWLQAGNSIRDAAPDVIAKLIPTGIPGVDKKDLPTVLDAASTLLASKDALAASGGISGDTSNVGLDFYSRAFKQARERAETVARGGGKPFELPPPPLVAFGETPAPGAVTAPAAAPAAPAAPAAGTVGYQNGRLVPQPPTVYKPLPPTAATPPAPAAPQAAAPAGPAGLFSLDTLRNARDALFGPSASAAPAPSAPAPAAPAPAPAAAAAPTKVPTMRYSANGEPMFRSEAEHQRAVKNGWLKNVTGIWVNGKHYTYQPDQPEGG
jgi:hypothetical protein